MGILPGTATVSVAPGPGAVSAPLGPPASRRHHGHGRPRPRLRQLRDTYGNSGISHWIRICLKQVFGKKIFSKRFY